MSWENEPPTNPPQAEGPAVPPFSPPPEPTLPSVPATPPAVDGADRATPPEASGDAHGAGTPGEEPPTVEVHDPFRPAPTAEAPPPLPPPVPPPPSPGPWGDAPPVAPSVPPGGSGAGFGGPPTPPPPLPVAPEPRRPNRALRALLAVVVVVGLFGLGFGARSLVDDNPDTVRGAATVSSIPEVTIDPGSEPVAAVAQAVSPSVVQIETSDGLGSGVVYDESGLIMTNAHVVGSATSVTVRTADGAALDGQVLGADTGTDIAVVRAEGLQVPAASLAVDTTPAVGQIAVAVGSPYGLDQTVTSGIVSAVNRPVDNDKGVVVNMIQTDASINPGNSGGALANRDGQIIGINTAIFSQTGENTGIGFAIPVATAKKAADQLVNGQSVEKAGLGISGPSETPNGDAGAYVESVTPDSAADQAGIRDGDLIVSVDDTAIRSFDELRGLISSRSPGETVTVTIVRDGNQQQVDVVLGTLASAGVSSGN